MRADTANRKSAHMFQHSSNSSFSCVSSFQYHVPLSGALAVVARARVPDRFVRHVRGGVWGLLGSVEARTDVRGGGHVNVSIRSSYLGGDAGVAGGMVSRSAAVIVVVAVDIKCGVRISEYG